VTKHIIIVYSLGSQSEFWARRSLQLVLPGHRLNAIALEFSDVATFITGYAQDGIGQSEPRTLNHEGIVAKEGRDLSPRFVKSLTDHLHRIRPERGAIDGVARLHSRLQSAPAGEQRNGKPG